MAGFAIRSRFAGHAGRSAKTRHALSLKPDHSIGAGQGRPGVVFKIGLIISIPLVAIVFFNTGFLYEKIVSELNTGYSPYMRYDLSRAASAELDLMEFGTAPFLGIGISTESRPLGPDRLPSNNGLTDYITRFGLLMFTYMLVLLSLSVRRYFRAEIPDVAAFLAIVILFSWSEKYFELPLFYVLLFAGLSGLGHQRHQRAVPD